MQQKGEYMKGTEEKQLWAEPEDETVQQESGKNEEENNVLPKAAAPEEAGRDEAAPQAGEPQPERICPVCDITYAPGTEYCAVCKAKLMDKAVTSRKETALEAEKRKKDWRWLIIGFLILVAVIYGMYWVLSILLK